MADEATNTILRVAPYLVFLAVFSVRVAQRRFDPVLLGLHAPSSAKETALWVLGFVTFAGAAEVVLNQLGLLEITSWQFNYPWWLVRAAGIVLLAPICEEIVFRGLLLNVLERRLGNRHLAVAIQAVAFVAVHAFAYEDSIGARIGVGQTFVDGCLFAYARRHTRSLLAPILMHATGNAIAVLERMAS